jgi:3-deoxy-7-phosphoheptulonate synthase/chorismate mutase
LVEPALTEIDPTIDALRARISANDRALIERVNDRLRLVAEMKAYKESRGIDFLDPDRERQMLDDLRRANDGPLSDEALVTFFAALLALTKDELD